MSKDVSLNEQGYVPKWASICDVHVMAPCYSDDGNNYIVIFSLSLKVFGGNHKYHHNPIFNIKSTLLQYQNARNIHVIPKSSFKCNQPDLGHPIPWGHKMIKSVQVMPTFKYMVLYQYYFKAWSEFKTIIDQNRGKIDPIHRARYPLRDTHQMLLN